jgi:Flp pilus assembly protein TadD
VLAGRAYAATSDVSTAEQLLKKAVALNANNLEAYGTLASLYARTGRLADATREFETIVSKRPDNVAAQTLLGMMLDMQDRDADARKRYEEALQRDPNAAVAANNLAWLMAEGGDNLDEALRLAQVAKAALPKVHQVSDTIGWIYYKKGAADLAVPHFKEAVDLEPKNASYHLHLGLSYAKTWDIKNAKESIERALSLDPKVAGGDEGRSVLVNLSR